ncbi:hypothetical protein [Clostridium gasigenes]|uniref:Uncharacterized protein n=1 Tax=Clostridium gasigenes TaxID=94869 RepID=A0A7X0SEZ3_9CLOT|nr:hypothetical protein [Clostridium gasigenes]MBB6716379.1 hypothetical protein [Clostridium gasigenes]
MFRDEDYFLNKLREDKVFYDIFIFIGSYSTTYNEKHDYFELNKVNLKEIISGIKTDVEKKAIL